MLAYCARKLHEGKLCGMAFRDMTVLLSASHNHADGLVDAWQQA